MKLAFGILIGVYFSACLAVIYFSRVHEDCPCCMLYRRGHHDPAYDHLYGKTHLNSPPFGKQR